MSAVTIPPGEWMVYQTVAVSRSGVELVGTGATLIPAPGVLKVVSVASEIDTTPGFGKRYQWHLTGAVTTATTQLTLDPEESCPVQAGDRVVVQPGVSLADPAEPIKHLWRTVTDRTGGVLTFDAPLGLDCPVYDDLDSLKDALGNQEFLTNKVESWGVESVATSPGRGLGSDHGLVTFVGEPVSGVTLTGLSIRTSLGDDAANGRDMVSAERVDGLAVVNLAVENPEGSCLFTTGCQDVTVAGLTATGRGRSLLYSGTVAGGAILVTSYAGTNQTYENVVGTAADTRLCNLEVGCTGFLFDGYTLDTEVTEHNEYAANEQHFAVAGDSDGVVFRDGEIAGDLGLFTVFSPPYEIDGVTFVGDPPAYLPLAGVAPEFASAPAVWEFPGGPWEAATYEVTPDDNPVVIPARLYRSLRVRASSGPAIASAGAAQRGVWLDAGGGWWGPPDDWYSVFPDRETYGNYLVLYVTTETGTVADCTLEFEVTRGPAAP